MLNKIKEFLSNNRKVVEKTGVIVKATPTVTHTVIKEEIAEIKDLSLTEVDKAQAEMIAAIAISAMMSLGIPVTASLKEIMTTAIAYGLRDIKEGCTNPEKLIVSRVVSRYKEKLAERNL